MATLVSDTHKAILLLQKKNLSAEQAEGIVEFVDHIDISHLATKDDLKDLKLDLYKALAAQTIVVVGAVVALFQFIR